MISIEKCEKILSQPIIDIKSMSKINKFSIKDTYYNKYLIYPSLDICKDIIDLYVNYNGEFTEDSFINLLEEKHISSRFPSLDEYSQEKICFLINIIKLRLRIDATIRNYHDLL